MWNIRHRRSDDNERGATAIEYVILIAGGFTMVSGASDLATGSMNDAFNDADSGVANVQIDEPPGDGDTDPPPDDGGGGGGGDEFPDAPGTGTIGYWKTHPEAWPVDTLEIGGQTYSKEYLLSIFAMNGNKPAMMASQLIGAKLNVLIENDDSCVFDDILAADQWLTTYPVASAGADVNAAWIENGDTIKSSLDDYNNGRLICAAHRG